RECLERRQVVRGREAHARIRRWRFGELASERHAYVDHAKPELVRTLRRLRVAGIGEQVDAVEVALGCRDLARGSAIEANGLDAADPDPEVPAVPLERADHPPPSRVR